MEKPVPVPMRCAEPPDTATRRLTISGSRTKSFLLSNSIQPPNRRIAAACLPSMAPFKLHDGTLVLLQLMPGAPPEPLFSGNVHEGQIRGTLEMRPPR